MSIPLKSDGGFDGPFIQVDDVAGLRDRNGNPLSIGVGPGGSGDMLAANNLSELASKPTARTNLGLGTLATQNGTFSGSSSGTNTGDQDLASYATAAEVAAGYQPLDSDLTAIAALTTTAFGRALLAIVATDAMAVPSGTTAQRPGSPSAGMIRWNTTDTRHEFHNGSAWMNHARLTGDTFTGALVAGTTFSVTGKTTFGDSTRNAPSTIAGLPLASTATGETYRLTDSVPAQRDARSDGTNWRYEDTGQVVDTLLLTYTPTGASPSQTVTLDRGPVQTINLGSVSSGIVAITLARPGISRGQLIVKQGATPRSATWALSAGTLRYSGTATAPSSGDTANKQRLYAWTCDGTDVTLSPAEVES